MLPLLLAMIVFAFLVLGAVVFTLCVILPASRRYALSAALWCATCGPCIIGLLLLAGLALIATTFINQGSDYPEFHGRLLVQTFGWTYLILGTLITICVATLTAWLHQVIVRRLTLSLFRMYVTIVCAGIGSVFGLSLGWASLMSDPSRYTLAIWLAGMAILIAGFGALAYKGAGSLRGQAPETFTWITPEEYAGR